MALTSEPSPVSGNEQMRLLIYTDDSIVVMTPSKIVTRNITLQEATGGLPGTFMFYHGMRQLDLINDNGFAIVDARDQTMVMHSRMKDNKPVQLDFMEERKGLVLMRLTYEQTNRGVTQAIIYVDLNKIYSSTLLPV